MVKKIDWKTFLEQEDKKLKEKIVSENINEYKELKKRIKQIEQLLDGMSVKDYENYI